MRLDKNSRDQMSALCGRVHQDDGMDPRSRLRTRTSRRNRKHKAIQLCRQVADTLGLVLAGEFDDELLHNLQVVAVFPAPDTSQLAVLVRTDLPADRCDPCQVLARLQKVAGRLRSEVASAITRKRTPRLVFHVLEPNRAGELST